MNRIYVVTGGCGHLGNTIVKKLLALGKRVRALALPSESLDALAGCSGVELFRGDVCQPDTLVPLFAHGPDEELAVIHTAALISIARKVTPQLREVNVNGVKHVVDLCLANAPARLVHVSSVHALPEQPGRGVMRESDQYHPEWVNGAYAKTKAEAAQYVLDAVRGRGLNASIVLPAGILGPGDFGKNHLNHTIRDCVTGKLSALVTGGYDFIDVRDIADACIAAVDRGAPGESYILGSRHYEWREIVSMLKDLGTGASVRHFFAPAALRPVAPLLELAAKLQKQQPLFTSYSIHCMQANDNFSSRKARKILGLQTRAMRETLADTAAWELARAAKEQERSVPNPRQAKIRAGGKKPEKVPAV